jgi:hypothetical protein
VRIAVEFVLRGLVALPVVGGGGLAVQCEFAGGVDAHIVAVDRHALRCGDPALRRADSGCEGQRPEGDKNDCKDCRLVCSHDRTETSEAGDGARLGGQGRWPRGRGP